MSFPSSHKMALAHTTSTTVSIRKEPANVQFATYLSWKVQDSFDIAVTEIDGRQYVSTIWCKSCRKHAEKIRSDHRLRGKAKTDCIKYADGTTNVVKCSVTRHLVSLVRMYIVWN
jgi:hypothetical protein